MLSKKIAALRRDRGLTQSDLAAYLQISRQAYSFYETGRNEMDLTALCKLADLYHVTVDYLLGRSNVTNAPFTDVELRVVSDFRELDRRGRDTVKAVLAFERKRGGV